MKYFAYLKRIFSGMKVRNACVVVIFALIMAMVYKFNMLSYSDREFVKNFDKGSESLVLGKILADKNRISTSGAGLGFLTHGKYVYEINKIMQSYKLIAPEKIYITDENWVKGISRNFAGFIDFNDEYNRKVYAVGKNVMFSNGQKRVVEKIDITSPDHMIVYVSGPILNYNEIGYPSEFRTEDGGGEKKNDFAPYYSSFGLQGIVFSVLFNKFGITKVKYFYMLNILILSFVLTIICEIICRKIDTLLGMTFYIIFILSPWITAFSSNLFWLEFTWFLPALFMLLYLNDRKRYYVYLPLMFISVFIKCLCGYEFISSILVFMFAFWIYDAIRDGRIRHIKTLIEGFSICVGSIISFACAFILHANIRGNGKIIDGIVNIWNADVLRRTIGGNPVFFDPVYKDSLVATPFQTVSKYFNWHTSVITGVDGQSFALIIFIFIIILVWGIYKKYSINKNDFILIFIFFMGSISWFVLAKSHSFIHTHINFVLWYFGFIQMLFYFIIKAFCNWIHRFAKGDNESI